MIQRVKIVVLAEENSPGLPLLPEHGLSLAIEADDRAFLFDTGQSDVFLKNAQTIGFDPLQWECVALSHGHFDHTGGLIPLLDANPGIAVYAHPHALPSKFKSSPHGTCEIGMPDRERFSKQFGHLLHLSVIPTEIYPGIWLTGEIPRVNSFEEPGAGFFLDHGITMQDTIKDDQALFIETGEGIICVLGCAHSGVINTLAYIEHLIPSSRMRAVIGGMHLMAASQERINETIRGLKDYAPDVIAAGHCTGKTACQAMKKEFGDRFASLMVGWEKVFDAK